MGAQVWFSTPAGAPAVEQAVDARFRAAGWQPMGGDTWAGTAAGSAARASLSLAPGGGGQWELMALAKPVGREASGC